MPTGKQTRRIAAWIYAVVNPIIDALEREPFLLEAGNLTWRAYLGRCEVIRDIQEYVDTDQWPNYQTFRDEHPRSLFVRGFDEHDSSVKNLNSTAQQVFEQLASLKEFLDAANSLLQRYEQEMQRHSQIAAPTDYVVRTELIKFSAEYVINNIQSLPSHYATAEFWNSFGREMLAFRNRAEFASLYSQIKTLVETSAKLRLVLRAYRLQKSRQYDIPAAPVPGLSLDAE